jgi:hypothetical protein
LNKGGKGFDNRSNAKTGALLEASATMKQAAIAPLSRYGDGKAYSKPHEIESFLPPPELGPV